MGKFCVAGGCSNSTKDGVSLHRFPKKDPYRSHWANAIHNTRKDWLGPTEFSFVCSAHFTEQCFQELYGSRPRFQEFGLVPPRKRLKEDAIPTKFGEKVQSSSSTSSDALGGPSTSTDTANVSGEPNVRPTPLELSLPVVHSESDWGDTGVKRRKVGGAFKKREHARILQAAMGSGSHVQTETSAPAPQSQQPATVRELVKRKLEASMEQQKEVTKSHHEECQTKEVETLPETSVTTSQAVQTDSSEFIEAYVQCELVPLPPLETGLFKRPEIQPLVQAVPLAVKGDPLQQPSPSSTVPEDTDESDESSGHKDKVPSSPIYFPSDSSDIPSDQGQTSSPVKTVPESPSNRIFLVMESCLLLLFKICSMCSGPVEASVWKVVGTLIRIRQKCKECGNITFWDSQTLLGKIPHGNLMVSAGVLFSGSKPSQALRVFQVMNCPAITIRTFHRHQKEWLHPTISRVWDRKQGEMVEGLKQMGMPLNLGGDGRSDSPGHSAKYGSYTFLDLDWNIVVHQELVQSNEVSSSNAMELEGLKRGLQFFCEKDLQINTLVTDRHRSIAKYLREEQQDTDHFYDIWHIAKGVSKKIDKLAKKKSCRTAKGWAKSVSNHLYWAAASTPDGDSDVILAKWLSVGNHIQDQHEHDSDVFPRCLHGDLAPAGRKKKWLEPSTEVCEKMVQLISNTALQKDVKQLSPKYQTSNVEAFHSVIIHFAPKSTHFSYQGMTSRLILAALHYNENSGREQATTKAGKERFVLRFPKYKKGEATVVKILADATYGYVDELMEELLQLCSSGQRLTDLDVTEPQPLASLYFHPDKEEAVEQHRSRFSTL